MEANNNISYDSWYLGLPLSLEIMSKDFGDMTVQSFSTKTNAGKQAIDYWVNA